MDLRILKKIKVLKYNYKPFHNWTLEDIHGPKSIIYITPKFNREGWYYNRKERFSWYEYVDEEGNIIAYTTKDSLYRRFEYELKILNHVPLLVKEIEAIKTIWKYTDTTLRELYYTDRQYKQLRDVHRSSRKHCIQSLKRLKEYKKDFK